MEADPAADAKPAHAEPERPRPEEPEPERSKSEEPEPEGTGPEETGPEETEPEGTEPELWRSASIPGSPFAVALDLGGTVLAKGTFNNLAQLESVLATGERRQSTLASIADG